MQEICNNFSKDSVVELFLLEWENSPQHCGMLQKVLISRILKKTNKNPQTISSGVPVDNAKRCIRKKRGYAAKNNLKNHEHLLYENHKHNLELAMQSNVDFLA